MSMQFAGSVRGSVRSVLRLEGLLALAVSTLFYSHGRGHWWLFVVLLFAPDLSFFGYLAGKRVGAAAYNTMHSYVGPLGLLAVSLHAGRALPVALIWFAHIGFDRVLGYGLKYESAFEHTHLGVVGKAEA